jgi:adenine-specific DNA-methyltransferase
VFLAEIVRRLATDVPREALPEAVEERVCGIDIDEAACERARDTVVGAVEQLCGPQRPDFFSHNIANQDFLELEAESGGVADLIVGNPPYVSAVNLSAKDKERFLRRFGTAWGRLDLYALFIEQGLTLLADGGGLAYITPDKWLSAQSSRRLRSHVSRGFAVRSIDRFDRHDLFPRVATVPCVTVIDRPFQDADGDGRVTCQWWEVDPLGHPRRGLHAAQIDVRDDGRPWTPDTPVAPVSSGARGMPPTVPLGTVVERISVGLATGLNRCFVVQGEEAASIEAELLRPIARGRDIQAGAVSDSGRHMLLPYRFGPDGDAAELVDLADYPGARTHLERHRDALERRHCVRAWGKAWYDLHDPVIDDLARRAKILAPDLAHAPRFALDQGTLLPCHSAYYLLLRNDAPLTGAELTDLLNTPAVAEDLRRRAPTAKSGYRRFRAQVLRELPIPLDRVGELERDAA